MKKKILSVTSILLVTIMLFAGCSGGKITRGTIEDDVYKNESLGINYKLGDKWRFLSGDEINELLGAAAEIMAKSGEDFTKEDLEKEVLIDMYAVEEQTNTNINININNLSLIDSVSSVEGYLDLTKKQLDTLGMGHVVSPEYKKEKLGKEEYTVMEAIAKDYNMSQYLYVRKEDKRLVIITFTIFGDGNLSDMTKNFS